MTSEYFEPSTFYHDVIGSVILSSGVVLPCIGMLRDFDDETIGYVCLSFGRYHIVGDEHVAYHRWGRRLERSNFIEALGEELGNDSWETEFACLQSDAEWEYAHWRAHQPVR